MLDECPMLSKVRVVHARVCEHVVRAQVFNDFACCSQQGVPGEKDWGGCQ